MRPALVTTLAVALAAAPLLAADPADASVAPAATAVTSRAAANPEDRDLAAQAAATLDVPSVNAATVGVAVRDLRSGRLVYTRNATTPLAPASTAKNRTVAAGLALLGPGFTWHTDVLARGTVSGGTLTGSIVLKGYGDPTLTRADLTALARKVRAAGITKVTGGIVTDATYFDAVRHHPDWSAGDFSQYYAAPVSGLTLSPDTDYDAGTIIVAYSPGTVGAPAKVTTIPAAAADYVPVVTKATTAAAGTGDRAWVDQDLTTGTITVNGSIAAGLGTQYVVKIAPSPQLFAGAVLRRELADAGVTVTGGTNPGTVQAGDTLLGTDRSMPLAQAIVPLLKNSNNLMAEHVLKTISAQAGGGGTWPDGTARVRAWMTRAGIPMTGVSVVDGSGLSRTNRETALSESGLLWSQRYNQAFYDALPVAGNPDRSIGGTLRNRLVGTLAANNLHAKTGTLTGVTALSGYVATQNGRGLSMSMISSYTGTSPRPVENALGLALASWTGVRTATAGTTTGLAAGAPVAATTSEWTKRTR